MAGSDKNIPLQNQEIIQLPMEEVMHNSMLPYAEYVILERALPRVEDGLKPVQRRILYTMSELSLTPDKPHRKCARIVGDCLGKYHPHGDTSVYDALVRMAQPFSLMGMLVDGHGNFGSIDGDGAAAMRYTEARMTSLAMLMLRDIEKDTVPFRLNFDDTLKEPDMLPARYPNLLVNGASGIAVGLATNIPPHHFGEAVKAVIAQIDKPDITVKELMQYIPAPDFPTGGILLNTEEIEKAYETGRGKLLLRAKVHIENGPSGRKLIVITEMPYQVAKAGMLEKILKLSEEKKAVLGGIYDIRDESDRTGLRAVIELRKDVDPQKVLNCLYKYSDMQVTFGVNMVAIAEGKPVQMGLREVIGHFIRHQKNVVTRRTQYDLDQAKARAHILEGLMVAVDNLDEVIALIRSSKTPKEAKQKLMDRFTLSDIQAQAILDMRLQRLTNLEILALRKEYEEVKRLIDKLEGILASERKLLNVIKAELTQMASEYNDPRRTQLVKAEEETSSQEEEAVVPEEAVVLYTFGGQLRRMYPKFFEKLPPPDPQSGLGEIPRFLFSTLTNHTLLFFTDRGNCYPLSVGSLPEANRPKDRGVLLTGVLAGLENGENLCQLLCVKTAELTKTTDFLFITSQGMVKRTAAAEYDVRRQKFTAINLKDGDKLIALFPVHVEQDILLISKGGQCIRFALDSVSQMGRATGGVKGMQLESGDELLWGGQIGQNDQVVLISDRGCAKRLLAIDFEAQGRNGKGVRCFAFNKNGSNGTCIAGCARIGSENTPLTVTQAQSAPSTIQSDDILLQAKADKGRPCVMALMEDVVTSLIAGIMV